VASAGLGTGGLVGRDRELAQLRGWLAEALGGSGRLAVLTGPPGIGKTRLAEELASTARSDGVRALWGRAVEDKAAPPLWPWRRVLNTLAGADTWARITGGETTAGGSSDDLAAARYRSAADAADALTAAAEQTGLLIVLEDLQWADLTSLFLLRELAGSLRESRLLIVATCRDVAGDEWRQSLGDLARLPGLQLLRLGALRAADVTGILGAAGVSMDRNLAELVEARSEGNPLYVSTLARVLAVSPARALDTDAVARIVGSSAEVSHLVTALLRGLDAEASAAVAAASVLGADFTPDLVRSLCGTADDMASALSAAAASGLVAPVPGRPGWWRFTHALLRDGVYASLSEAQRTGLHRRAAAALEREARKSPDRGGEVAGHLLAAAPDAQGLRGAAHWAEAAATAATYALAFEDAARYLATAVTAAQRAGSGDPEQARLLVELATAEYRAGQLGASLQHAEAAAGLADGCGQPELAAAAALVVRGVGHPDVANKLLRLCDQALAVGDRCPDALRARLLAQRAAALAELGELAAAGTVSAAAMTLATAAGDPVAELDAVRARAAALPAPRSRGERLRLGTRAIELGRTCGQPLAECLGRVWRIDAAYQLLNMRSVDDEISQIAQLAEATRLPLIRWHLLRQQASRAALAGQFDLARDRSSEAYRLAIRLQDQSAAGLSHAFAVSQMLVRGDPGEIPADLIDMAASYPALPIVRADLASALFSLGRAEEAEAIYATLRSLPAAGASDTRNVGAILKVLDMVIAFRDTQTAQATYDLLRPHAAETGAIGTGVVVLYGSLHWPLGRLAALLGLFEDALEHYATAVSVNTKIGARPFVALARLGWADALRGRAAPGDNAAALVLAGQAAAETRRLDMPGHCARANELVRALQQAAAAGDPLTRREHEIAELVSAGLTNRAIADRLVLSERTVEGHVRNMLAKLQLANRTELAAWALRGSQAP
jgi:DNA-binding CsgD family transcriptional regulator